MSPEQFPLPSAHDEKTMEHLVAHAHDILDIEKEVVNEGKEILFEEVEKEKEYLEEKFDELLSDEIQREQLYTLMKEQHHLDFTQTDAMINTLRHELRSFYDYGEVIRTPDESKHLRGIGLKQELLDFITHDYGEEVAKKINPFVDLYLTKAVELIKNKKEE
ncbi:MAG: hypothetical protein WCW78_02450 [Candidatus Paceibacterota bacterium]|jgi:hypothetical protein